MDAAIRYYLHINPDELNDQDWANCIAGLNWIRNKEAEKK